MSGELWTSTFATGKETVEGTAVPCTRKVYAKGHFTRVRAANVVQVATGTRDNQRDVKMRSVVAGGQIVMPLSADEIIELLLQGIQGGVTPTTALGASTWVLKPTAAALDSGTWEWFDGYRNWQLRGCHVDQIKLAGKVDTETTVTADLFAREMIANAATTGLTDRVPDYHEGWETKLYLDAFAGTPRTTPIASTMISWDVTIKNNLGRKYYADNTTATGAITTGMLDVSGSLLFEGNAAALTEFNNRDSATKRLIGLEFGNNTILGTSALKKSVTIDIPGAWVAVDLTPEDAGTKAYKFDFQYVYDPTNAYGVQVRALTTRATAY